MRQLFTVFLFEKVNKSQEYSCYFMKVLAKNITIIIDKLQVTDSNLTPLLLQPISILIITS